MYQAPYYETQPYQQSYRTPQNAYNQPSYQTFSQQQYQQYPDHNPYQTYEGSYNFPPGYVSQPHTHQAYQQPSQSPQNQFNPQHNL